MDYKNLNKKITEASNVVGNTWPLYSFVTSNPLAGYQDMPFNKAVDFAKMYLGSQVYPEKSIYEKALNAKEINEDILKELLSENGFNNESIAFYLNQIENSKTIIKTNKNHELDRLTTKWLSSFFDEGLAEWPMPKKEQGFFKAWRFLAKYDEALHIKNINEIPETSENTLNEILKPYSEKEYIDIFIYHLAALPGWVGYIKHRVENNTEWQKAYPITLLDYLAVRLFIADKIGANITPEHYKKDTENDTAKLQHLFLQAWEATWQKSISRLMNNNRDEKEIEKIIPDAQLVFCIDTRSELIRRHIESKGNYETFGYAGFFGIATDYEDLETGVIRKSCPPILPSSYKTSESPQVNKKANYLDLKKSFKKKHFKNYLLKRLKNMLPSAFGYVEGTGVFYGVAMLIRTVLPDNFKKIKVFRSAETEHICEPKVCKTSTNKNHEEKISLNEKVSIVKSAFDLLDWRKFAPLVIFTGHGSHTANNPFASSLDCGACAASPGRHNARLLAKLANEKEVRNVLSLEHGIAIPEETIFVGAEHNTTTDEIILFNSSVPPSHTKHIKALKYNLGLAQISATQERLQINDNSKKEAIKKSESWSETRPEWGLAKNAGFIIGSRELTKNLNLEGRCFLHSYEWELDDEGKALEGIMQGPMVVTQWINNHYYFSTVDNEKFGGGTKITHNIIGKFGVVQGNGGDLKTGLPLQSVSASDTEIYHQPLRLSVMIHAPKSRVSEILLSNPNLKSLLDNEWIYLLVMDPLNSNEILKYKKNLNWETIQENQKTHRIKREEKVFA